MALSCDCVADYEWYYIVAHDETIMEKPFKCYGCCNEKAAGEPVRQVDSVEYDEYGEEVNGHSIGHLCEECAGLYDSLLELGFCLTADWGFVASAMDEYREDYVPRGMG